MAGAAVLYVLARAVSVPMTYDEALSLSRFVAGDPLDVFDFSSATNHFAHTLLVKLAHSALGDSPLVLRLPTVLSAVVYAGTVLVFAGQLRNPVLRCSATALFLSNPYILDYLTLSRGYGLSLACSFVAMTLCVRWATIAPRARSAHSLLIGSLLAAALAVLANFGTAYLYMALLAVASVRLLVSAPPPDDRAPPLRRWRASVAVRWTALWVAVTMAMATVVIYRAWVWPPTEYLPVTAQVLGLTDDELGEVSVQWADSTGRWFPLRPAGHGRWAAGPTREVQEVQLVLPRALVEYARVIVTAGRRRHAWNAATSEGWRVRDFTDGIRLMRLDPVDWSGDRQRAASAAMQAVPFGAAALALSVLAYGLTALFNRYAPSRATFAVAVAHITLGLSALALPPLWLLRRDGQLFFGGTTGLTADTFGSLAVGTFYGAAYHPLQVQAWVIAALLIVVGSVIATLVGLTVSRWSDPPLLVASTVTALVLAQALVLNGALSVPLPIQRTALFILPLLMMCGVLLADLGARSGGVSAWVASLSLALLALLSGAHLWAVANLSFAVDWKADSATPAMITAALTVPHGSTVAADAIRVGVGWQRFPVAQYYARRTCPEDQPCDVVVYGTDGLPVDVIYREARSGEPHEALIAVFPEVGTVLVRATP
jgi:hypothetical protein